VLGFGDELGHHGLDNADISVEQAADGATEEGDPDVGRKSYHDQAE
jgi:hypothetical protein